MSDELITIHTFNQNHTRAGEICQDPTQYWTDDEEISGDVTEWTGTREDIISDHLWCRACGRPNGTGCPCRSSEPRSRTVAVCLDFRRTVSRNILEFLDYSRAFCSTCDGTDSRLSGSLCPECGS